MKTRLYDHLGRSKQLKWGRKKNIKGDNSNCLVTLVTNLVISHEHTLRIFKIRSYHFDRIYCYLIIKYIFQKEDYVPPKYFRLLKENTPECVFIIMGCVASGINGCTMPIFAIVFGEMIKVFYYEEELNICFFNNNLIWCEYCNLIGWSAWGKNCYAW